MKLQLDENTLNAYINEAMKQEINEGVWDKLASFASKKAAGKAAKTAGKIATRKATATASRDAAAKGSKTLIGASRKSGIAARDVNRYNKALINAGKVDSKDVKQLRKLQNLKRQGKITPEQDKELRTLERNLSRKGFLTSRGDYENLLRARRQQAAIAGGVGAIGGAYMLGRNGKGGQKDPNAPWNSPEDGNGDNGGNGNGDGWNGEFPWDDVQPRWTPKPKKKQPQPNPVIPKKPSIMDTPLEKVDASKMNLPTGVTQANAPGLDINRPMPQPTIAQSAIHTMAQTTNANDNRPLQGRADLNRRTARDAKDIINQNVQNGNMTRQDARAQKQLINQARRNLNRTGQPISN